MMDDQGGLGAMHCLEGALYNDYLLSLVNVATQSSGLGGRLCLIRDSLIILSTLSYLLSQGSTDYPQDLEHKSSYASYGNDID